MVIRYSTRGWSEAYDTYQWGLNDDVPFGSDFDGDGRSDLVVYRPSTGGWFIRTSSTNYSNAYLTYHWGVPGDIPIPADFDGDRRSDLAVYRPSTGQWFVRFSSRNFSEATYGAYQWGVAGDIPMVTDFDGDRKAELTVYRPSDGTWNIRFLDQQLQLQHLDRAPVGLCRGQSGYPAISTATPAPTWPSTGRRPANGSSATHPPGTASAYAAYQWGAYVGDLGRIVPQTR